MQRINIRTLVLGPISTNTYICSVYDHEAAAHVQDEDADDFELETRRVNPLEPGAKACFIVDPAANAPFIIETLGAVTPSAILLTHGHFDHLMAVNELREHYPGIKVYASQDDAEVMLHPGLGIVRKEFTSHAVKDFTPVYDKEKFRIGDVEIEVITTPGHTKGGVCYYIADNRVMFTGDTLFKESYGRTDFETGDYDELKASITKKLFPKLQKEGHVDILPGHMEPTTSENELARNPILG